MTGPKTHFWLVELVGLLLAISGTVILVAQLKSRLTPEIVILAISSAVVIAAIGIFCAATNRIASVYVADAAVELALTAWWIWWLAGKRRQE